MGTELHQGPFMYLSFPSKTISRPDFAGTNAIILFESEFICRKTVSIDQVGALKSPADNVFPATVWQCLEEIAVFYRDRFTPDITMSLMLQLQDNALIPSVFLILFIAYSV